jgi:hypothetical protein
MLMVMEAVFMGRGFPMVQMRQGVLFRWRNEFAAWLRPEWVDLIIQCVKGGLADFDNPEWVPTHVRLVLSPRSEASLRHDFIVHHFESELIDVPELRMKRRHGHVLIWVADEAVATIKKISEKTRLAMPNKTWSSHNILSDAPTLMEDMPSEAQQIVIGYTVDETGTQYRYYITCPSQVGLDNHWVIDITDAATAELVVFTAPEDAMDTESVEVDDMPGRVGLTDEGARRAEEVEAAERNEEERRGTDDSSQ